MGLYKNVVFAGKYGYVSHCLSVSCLSQQHYEPKYLRTRFIVNFAISKKKKIIKILVIPAEPSVKQMCTFSQNGFINLKSFQ